MLDLSSCFLVDKHCAGETSGVAFQSSYGHRSTHRTVGLEDSMPFDAVKFHAQRHEWKDPRQNWLIAIAIEYSSQWWAVFLLSPGAYCCATRILHLHMLKRVASPPSSWNRTPDDFDLLS